MTSDDKPVIVLTGVTSGIGRCLARKLSHEFQIFGTVRDLASADALTSEINGIKLFKLDMSSPDSIRIGWKQIIQELGNRPVKALINNAGYALPGAILDLTHEALQDQLQVNLLAPADLIRRVVPHMIPGEGRIINISSVSGLFASPFMGAYAASKFALEGLSDALRRELALIGIGVVIIEPGPLTTPIWSKNLGLDLKHRNSRFAVYLEGADQQIKAMEAGALPVERILAPVLQAIKHKRPKIRYLVHRHPWMIRTLVHLLPSRFADRLVLKRIRSKSKKFRPI